MPNFQLPSLAQVAFLLHFSEVQTKVRFTQGDAEVAFGAFGSGQSQQTNVLDDADPSVPRIVFAKAKKNIAISQLAVQYAQGFDPGECPVNEQVPNILSTARSFYDQALEYRSVENYASLGMVLMVNYPSTSPTDEIHKFVYDRFVALPSLGDVASVQMTLGFKISDLFVNLGASVYETRQFDFKGLTPFKSISMRLDQLAVIAKGMQINLDVNSRARVGERAVNRQAMEDVISMATEFLYKQLPTIVGPGIGK
ncbi:hypothetical protein NTJ56_05670 [Burkholderia contaminans]|uniref:hypothetical protein n=1 Tax=Burkholderia contaminans TaxID=488447 RepID=UPI001CF1C1C3|nr:hypothetical protein [Burkholderia contaminans]MCA7918457.1 hypothetical protein [Burkholderia contaminans]UUX38300.1 hypothetical protein NTJ56_05670 [Burkholderia contaminans]